MRVSQKTEYALNAMLELALRLDPAPMRTADIARNRAIPEKFLELILVELRRAGLITSHRGPEGGHRLSKAPERISVGDIWRAIEGDAPGKKEPPPRSPNLNPFAGVWQDVDKAVLNVVDNTTLQDIQRRAEARQSIPDFSI